MPSAVTASVSHTVATAPMRAPRKAHTSLPDAPPANTKVSARPTVGRLAPLAVSTNGRNVRKAMRVALSMTPTDSSSGKPNWLRREPAPAPASLLQRREAAVHEGVIELVDDRVVHRPAELRVRMQDDRDRRVLLPRRVVAALDPSGRTGEDDFRHCCRPRNRLAAIDPRHWIFCSTPDGTCGAGASLESF